MFTICDFSYARLKSSNKFGFNSLNWKIWLCSTWHATRLQGLANPALQNKYTTKEIRLRTAFEYKIDVKLFDSTLQIIHVIDFFFDKKQSEIKMSDKQLALLKKRKLFSFSTKRCSSTFLCFLTILTAKKWLNFVKKRLFCPFFAQLKKFFFN